MPLQILVYAGALILAVWGIAHIVPTGRVVAGFGPLSRDNRLTITMTWVSEGLFLIFAGVLPAIVTLQAGARHGGTLVCQIVAVMLLISAGWSAITGARTQILPMKLCPFVKLAAALLLVLGTAL
jgi:hypothetical protein